MRSNILDLKDNLILLPQSSNLRVVGSTPTGFTIISELYQALTKQCPQFHKITIVVSELIYAVMRKLYWSNPWSNPFRFLFAYLSGLISKTLTNCGVAQLVEQGPVKTEVVGSCPTSAANIFNLTQLNKITSRGFCGSH